MKTSVSKPFTTPAYWIALALAAGLALGAVACGDDDSADDGDAGTDIDTDFECSEDTGGWEQCVDNMVQYCHIVDGMDPHFHWGADCESLGLTCIELSESEAACLDQSATCTAGEFYCEENTAYNCVEYDGAAYWAIEPCGTAATCTAEDGGSEAYCDAAESTFDPQDACDAMTGSDVEEKAVVTVFADVFSEDTHADLGAKVHVTLPDNAVSYIHFPVFTCGEFAVFLDTADVFDVIQHRDETEMAVSGDVPVELCSEDIPEHWHADLEWDGDGTEGTDPVPYVIRFKAVVGGGEVNFAVFQIASEE